MLKTIPDLPEKTVTCLENKTKSKICRARVLASLALGLLVLSIPFREQKAAVDFHETTNTQKHYKGDQQSLPSVIYVNERCMATSPDGNSWSSAYQSLTQALEGNMSDKKEIWIAKGAYGVRREPEQTKRFSVISGIDLYGGFTGSETNREQRNWKMNTTILSGLKGSENGLFQNAYNLALGSGVLSITMPESPSSTNSAQPELVLYIAKKQCEITPVP